MSIQGKILSINKWPINCAQRDNKLPFGEDRQRKTWKFMQTPNMCWMVQYMAHAKSHIFSHLIIPPKL